MSSKLITPHQLPHSSPSPSAAEASRPAATPSAGTSHSIAPDLHSPKSASRQSRPPKRRAASAHTTLSAHGAPLVWLTGGALATALVMIIGLLVLVFYQGLQTFWPQPVVQLELTGDSNSGQPSLLLGETVRTERFHPDPTVVDELKLHAEPLFAKAQAEMKSHDGTLGRQLLWTGRTNAVDFAGNRALWVDDYAVESTSRPEWATVLERLDGGRSYGTPAEFLIDGKSVATGPDNVWRKYNEYHGEAMARWAKSVSFDRNARGAIDRRERSAPGISQCRAEFKRCAAQPCR